MPDRLRQSLRQGLTRNRLRLAVVALSVVFHAGLIAFAGMKTGLDMSGHRAPPEPLYIRIEPRPLMAGEVERDPPPLTVIEEPRETIIRGGAVLIVPDEEDEDETNSTRIAPRPSGAAPATESWAQGVDPQWRVRPESGDDRLARGMAGAGLDCNRPVSAMTEAQRALCERRLVEARDAPSIRGSGDRERDAAFARQGAANIRNYEAQRAPLAGGTGVIGVGDCPGANLGMGCAGAHLREVPGADMRQGATTTHTPTQQRRSE